MEPWAAKVLDRLRSPALEALSVERGVWIVGGAVRDVLLGREPREIDLVVEGDAVDVAWRRFGDAAVTVHDRFCTATVAGMDLATARTETYAAPGALPDVRPAPIEQDLARRDFTVNTLAVRLADGRGIAYPGAHDDLAAGVLRVLHERSFLDDPTRLLRLARYSGRLAFTADPVTDRLAREAVAGGAVDTVSGPRIGAELRLLAAEPQPEALAALAARGLGRAVLGAGFSVDHELIERAIAATPRGGRADLAALATTLVGMPREQVSARLDELAFPAAERDALAAATEAQALADALLQARSPSEVARAARRAPPEALAVAAALGADEPVEAWLEDWSRVRLRINGDDLLAEGLEGPQVGAGLAAALDAVLDGRAYSREDELRAALATIRP